MRIIAGDILVLSIGVAPLLCQAPANQAPAKLTVAPPPRGTSTMVLSPTPSQIFKTLEALCSGSDLIIEGTIVKTLPARQPSIGSLETDSIV